MPWSSVPFSWWGKARRSCTSRRTAKKRANARPAECRGAGYIGSFTALALLENDYDVVVADNLYNSSDEVFNRIELICGKRPAFVNLDVTDEAAFDRVFEKYPAIDSVIHFAALKAS